MACCLFLLRLLAPLFDRLGVDRPRAPRIPAVAMTAFAASELLAAAWVVRTYAPPAEGGATATTSHHDMASMSMPAPAGATTGPGALVSLLVGAGVLLLAIRVAGRLRNLTAIGGALLGTVAVVVAQLDAAHESHLVLMVVVEAGLVLGPLAVVGGRAHPGDADDIWVVARGALALLAAGLAAFVLVTLHLPATHTWYLRSDHVVWWLPPLLLAAGSTFWASVLRFRLPTAWRSLLVALVFETGAVIGLVLLLANEPLMAMGSWSGLDAVTDQRLAGGLMMVVDLGVLAWVLEPTLRLGRRQLPHLAATG